MTYIDYLNDFNKWLRSNYLPGNVRLLYYSLLAVFNEAGWPESVQVDNYRLMSMIDVRTERVAISARDKLVDYGFIRYNKGKKGCPNTYFLTKYTGKKVSQFDSESGSVSGSVSVSQSVSQKCSHIKTKTKKKTKNISPLPPDEKNWGFGDDLAAAISDWLTYKEENRQGYTPTSLKVLIAEIQKNAAQYGEAAMADLIRRCTASGWQGIAWDKLGKCDSSVSPSRVESRTPYEGPSGVKADMDRMQRYLQQLRGENQNGKV